MLLTIFYQLTEFQHDCLKICNKMPFLFHASTFNDTKFKFCSCYLLQQEGWQRKKKIEKVLISVEWKSFWSEIGPFHWPNKSIKQWSIGNTLCGQLLTKLLVQKFNSYLQFFVSNFLKGIHCSNNPHCNINLITTHILTSIFRLLKIMEDLAKNSSSWCF